jgi:ubiquinone/menaquinone biosynthesis C-methylase UbiE
VVISRLPQRIAWAIETLQIRPNDRLLEIGCGRGVAVAAISARLNGGKITAIDRSDTAIEATRQRTAAAVASGTVALRTVALEAADFPDGSFNKVFAINVNLFWVKDPAAELALIRRALTGDGRLFLFNEPPSAVRIPELERALTEALNAHGFTVSTRTATRAGRSLLGVIGRLPVRSPDR